jgi:hypothetical protein
MLKISLWRKVAVVLLALVVTACGGAGGSAQAPAGGLTLTPGNGQVTVTWTADPGVQYWLMYAPTTAALDINNPPNGHLWASNITSPYVVPLLTNGTTYAFAMNGRTGGGKGGAQTASQSAVPRAAGSTWKAGTLSDTATAATRMLRSTTYGTSSADALTYFAAVGDGGAIYKTQNTVTQGLTGHAWTLVTPATAIATDFRAATYAFGQFIAVGANGTVNNVFFSADLATWTAATTAVTAPLNALASNGTTLVAVGDGGRVFYTTDAKTWTAATGIPAGITSNLYGVAYSSTLGWVVVGQAGTLMTSPDLLTWTVQTSNAGGNDLNGVTVTSGNMFVAVGNNGTVITNSTMTSTAAGTWNNVTLGTAPNNLYAINTDSVQFLAVGQGGIAFTSLDGLTWTPVASTGTSNDLLSIYGSAYKYMVVGKAGTTISSIN